jgi:hypothetical protein
MRIMTKLATIVLAAVMFAGCDSKPAKLDTRTGREQDMGCYQLEIDQPSFLDANGNWHRGSKTRVTGWGSY